MRRITLFAILLCFWFTGCDPLPLLVPDGSAPLYYGTIETVERVYDGDTIRDVAIQIYPLRSQSARTPETSLMLWPGIERRVDGIYSITNIRIAGIDTPEKYPTRAGRTEVSLQREKQRAAAATDFLKQLLLENSSVDGGIAFVIRNPQPDKYAGRVVADIFCVNGDVSINVAEALLTAGHAVVYTGGTKTHDWGAE